MEIDKIDLLDHDTMRVCKNLSFNPFMPVAPKKITIFKIYISDLFTKTLLLRNFNQNLNSNSLSIIFPIIEIFSLFSMSLQGMNGLWWQLPSASMHTLNVHHKYMFTHQIIHYPGQGKPVSIHPGNSEPSDSLAITWIPPNLLNTRKFYEKEKKLKL